MNPARQLTPAAFARAAAFLHDSRPLDRAFFAFHFENAPAAPALAALASHQNPDGGFHSLEADIGFPVSTVLSTCHALHCLRDLHPPTDHPLVQRTLAYLLATYDEAHTAWPIIPPHDNSQPHAPWWHSSALTEKNWLALADNPRPDVLAGLLTFPSPATAALTARVVATTLERLRPIAASGEMEMHGLLCYLRLHCAPNLPPQLKQSLDAALPSVIAKNVTRDPAQWTGYGLRPLDVAPFADSPWRTQLAPEVEAHLDFVIGHQNADGSWHPHWNWGRAFPEAWPAAKLKWQAVLTLANLRTLRSYGRLA
jgi:hypothetical protein